MSLPNSSLTVRANGHTHHFDGSLTATSQPNITAQYGPKPESEFTTGILFVKTKNTNGENTFAYYHHDHLDTPIQATDKQGNVVWSAIFHPYGKVTLTTSPTPDKPTIISNLRFPGQYEDEESGLYYNGRRYYDPETGRYVTSDPIGFIILKLPMRIHSSSGKTGWWCIIRGHTLLRGVLHQAIQVEPSNPEKEAVVIETIMEQWVGDKYGNIWEPTGEGGAAHGDPHWDVQRKGGGGYCNIYPEGRRRGGWRGFPLS